MTSGLVRVADAAVPFDYAALPHDVVAVLGYVGESGATPHVWSTQEADAARKAVGAWSAIWVPPQGLVTRDDGARAAHTMLKVLPQYQVGTDHPVFFDIERSTYDAHPTEADSAIASWSQIMRGAGYHLAYPYAPVTYGRGWIAHYVDGEPTELPTGYIGQQYTNNGDGGSCDFSVFDRAVFTAIINNGKGDTVALDKADKAWIVAQLGTLQHNVNGQIAKLHDGGAGEGTWPRNVAATYEEVVKLSGAVAGLKLGGVDVDALAADLAAKLGPDVAAAVLDAAAKRLGA